MSVSTFSRRQYLAAFGSGGISLLSGCVNPGDSSSTSEAPSLWLVEFDNKAHKSFQSDIMIQKGGEIIHWKTHTIDADASESDPSSIPIPHTETPEPFTIAVRLETGATAWTDSTDVEWIVDDETTSDHECILVTIRIRDGGEKVELIRFQQPPERCFDRTGDEIDE